MTPEQMAHLGALIYAGEQSALAGFDLLNPPGGLTHITDDNMRIALAQAQALVSFALTMSVVVQANPGAIVPEHDHPVPAHDHPAAAPEPEP